MGNSIVYLRILNWSPRPPISEKSTFPGSSFIILKTIGSTYLGNTLIIVKVVWSNATLAPTVNLDRSILAFTPTTFLGPLDDLIISKNNDEFYIFINLVIWELIQWSVQQIVMILVDYLFLWFLFFYLLIRIVLKKYYMKLLLFLKFYSSLSCLAFEFAYYWMSFSLSVIWFIKMILNYFWKL
jgi:hypothetical protein